MRCARSVPSGFIIQMSQSPSRSELKAIFDPSGDQAGSWFSLARVLVKLYGWEPSAFMIQMLLTPDCRETKAILRPSGDQVGWLSCSVLTSSGRSSEPSAFITQRSPSRSNTIDAPLEEKLPLHSS